MCGGGGFVDFITGKTFLKEITGERRAEKKAKARAAELAAEQAAITEAEEKKRKQRKATATILTSGQGLNQEGGSLGQ